MTDTKRNSHLAQKETELAALRTKSISLEEKMKELLQHIDGNSNYRNDIIWLAQEINKVQKQIIDLGSDDICGRT